VLRPLNYGKDLDEYQGLPGPTVVGVRVGLKNLSNDSTFGVGVR
jgi:hypothetical protein